MLVPVMISEEDFQEKIYQVMKAQVETEEDEFKLKRLESTISLRIPHGLRTSSTSGRYV